MAPEEPLDLLMACHERIRRFLGGFQALARHPDLLQPVALATAAQALRYFREALPLHAADEDDSLAPRLDDVGADVAAAIDAMEAQHVQVEAVLVDVVALLTAVANGQSVDREQLRTVQQRFQTLLLDHIDTEERLIFPEIARLPNEERARMVVEMRARRR